MTETNSPPALDALIVELCARAPAGRTICPTDAAKAFAEARGEDELGWRSHLMEVRRAAVRLANEGRLVITRKGKWSIRTTSAASTASARRRPSDAPFPAGRDASARSRGRTPELLSSQKIALRVMVGLVPTIHAAPRQVWLSLDSRRARSP